MKLRQIQRRKERKWMNKKGQFEDFIILVVSIFIVGVILFFMNHMADQLYTSLDKYFNTTEAYNQSEARDALAKIQTVENSVWDWAFLGIFAGMMLSMILLSFATRISIAFFWIFGLLAIIVLIVGVMLSNTWQEIADTDEFSTTITRFPITNAILGTYYPTAIVAILLIGMIVLFGKPPQSGGLESI